MAHRRAVVVVAALLATALVPAAHAGRCRGPFRRSCLNELYRCFDAQGGCTVQTIPVDDATAAGYTVTCFGNGARAVTRISIASPSSQFVESSTELINAAGEKCVDSFAVADRSRGSTDIALVNVQTGQEWRILYTRSRMIVSCPLRRGRRRARTERYSLQQAQRADCGSGNGPCAPGNCGF